MHDARESDYGDIMYKRSAPKPSYAASEYPASVEDFLKYLDFNY